MPYFSQAPGGEATDMPDDWIALIGANDLTTLNKYINKINLASSLSYMPNPAKITSAAEWNAAIAAGKQYLYLTTTFTLTQDNQLISDTFVFRAPGVSIQRSIYRTDINNHSLSFASSINNAGEWRYQPVTIGNRAIYNSQGANAEYPVSFFNERWINDGSVAATSICEDAPINAINLYVESGSADFSGIAFVQAFSSFDNLIISTATSNATTSLVTAAGCCNGTNLSISNGGGVTGTLVSMGANCNINNVIVSGVSQTKINLESGSVLSNISTSVPVDIYISGANAKLANAELSTGTLTFDVAATNPTITACHATGTYTDNSVVANLAGNSGTIPNSTLAKSSNLSDLASASTARTNLGLKDIATKATAAVRFTVSAATITVQVSRNVDSVGYSSAGVFDINITAAAFADANYVVLGTVVHNSGVSLSGYITLAGGAQLTSTLCQIITPYASGTLYDPAVVTVYLMQV